MSDTSLADTDANKIEEPSTSYARPVYAWYLVFIVTLAYSLAVVDRVSLGLLVEFIQTDLNLSDTQFGLLHGLAFVLFFAVAGLPLGMAVDRWSRKKVLLLGSLVLALATIGSAFAGTFLALFLARILVGAGDSSISPASSALIADAFPPKKRALAFGVYASGIAIGSGAAFIASAGLINVAIELQTNNVWIFPQMTVWQACFFLMGIPGVLLSILILFTIKEYAGNRADRGSSENRKLKDLVAHLSTKKTLYFCLILGVAITYIAGNAFFSWYVAFLIRVFEFSPQQAGSMIGAITVPIGLFSAISSGWVTSWFYRRNRKDAPVLTILIMIVTSCSFLFASAMSPTATLSLAFFGLSAATVNWGFPATLTALNNITPAHFRGQVTALFTMTLGIFAVGIGPVITGAFSDYLFGGPEHIGKSLALVSFLCGVIGFTLVMMSRKSYVRENID